jgi:hypothetical protein
MLFGGTFDPAYVMTITALPSHLQATTNKRNAALIQKHMQEALGVIPSRGYLRFVPTAEELTACNGKTLAGQIEELEKRLSGSVVDDNASITSGKSRSKKRSSVRVSLRPKGHHGKPANLVPDSLRRQPKWISRWECLPLTLHLQRAQEGRRRSLYQFHPFLSHHSP